MGKGAEKKRKRKTSAALKVPVSIMASIIHKWKKSETIRALSGQSEVLGKKGLSQGGDQEPNDHSDRAPSLLCGDRITF